MWVSDLEKMRLFYSEYCGAQSGKKYTNPAKGFESYFLSFADGARLELMKSNLVEAVPERQYRGIAHFAFSAGSEDEVNLLTSVFSKGGFLVLDGPRWTGDGYYESVIQDPEGNKIEITI